LSFSHLLSISFIPSPFLSFLLPFIFIPTTFLFFSVFLFIYFPLQ
jgi:hypothetical protein